MSSSKNFTITKACTKKTLPLLSISSFGPPTNSPMVYFEIPVDPLDLNQFNRFGSKRPAKYVIKMNGQKIILRGIMDVNGF
jgi:hypothetical protein